MATSAGLMPASLNQFIQNAQFSDLIIQTKEREIKVHKVILCACSDYFRRMLTGEWKETNESVVNLKADSPDAVEVMIQSMYDNTVSAFAVHLEVYRAADKYLVRQLKKKAKDKFKVALVKAVEDACNTKILNPFIPQVIEDVYGPRYRGGGLELRKIVMAAMKEHLAKLIEMELISRVLEEVPGFGADAVRHLVNDTSKQYECPVCFRTWSAKIFVSRYPGQSDVRGYCPHCGRFSANWEQYMLQAA